MEHLADLAHAQLLKTKQVNLLYVTAGPIRKLTGSMTRRRKYCLFQVHAQPPRTLKQHKPLDPANSGSATKTRALPPHCSFCWMSAIPTPVAGLEMESQEVSTTSMTRARASHDAQLPGMLVFTNSHDPRLDSPCSSPRARIFRLCRRWPGAGSPGDSQAT